MNSVQIIAAMNRTEEGRMELRAAQVDFDIATRDLASATERINRIGEEVRLAANVDCIHMEVPVFVTDVGGGRWLVGTEADDIPKRRAVVFPNPANPGIFCLHVRDVDTRPGGYEVAVENHPSRTELTVIAKTFVATGQLVSPASDEPVSDGAAVTPNRDC